MTTKRDHFFAEVEKFKELYRQYPSADLKKIMPHIPIKAAAAAVRAVLREREQAKSDE